MKGVSKWKCAGSDWYTCCVYAGSLLVRVDVWDVHNGDWAMSFNSGKVECIKQQTAEGAMRAAEVILASYFTAAAKALRRGDASDPQ